MRSIGLTRRVLLTSAVLLVLAVTAGAAVAVTDLQLQDTQRLQDDEDVARQADAQLLQDFVDEETGLRGYLLTGEPAFLAPFTQAQAALPDTMATFRAHDAAFGGPAALAQRLGAAHDAWLDYADQQIDRARSGQLDQARTVAATSRGKQLFDSIRSSNAAITSSLDRASRSTGARSAALQRRLSVLLVVALAALLAVVASGCVVLWTSVTRPLARLAAATRRVADGDLTAELPSSGAPEMRSLAADVRAMRDRLTAELHTAQRSLTALEQTGPAVLALRAALEPCDDRVPGLHVAARLDPAEGVLAGDWYDTVALGPTRLALVLGDVAGHGPAAAVFALRLKHSLTTALRTGSDPGEALTQLSGELAEVPPGQFATALIAVLDTAEDTLTYANAGHPAGLLLEHLPTGEIAPAQPGSAVLVGDGEQRPSWTELPSTGPLLSSIVHGWAWNTATRPFRPGDALLAVTDGVLESRDDGGAEFGTRGILDAVRATGSEDGERVVAAVAAASMRFGGNRPRRDDHTVVHVRRVSTVERAGSA